MSIEMRQTQEWKQIYGYLHSEKYAGKLISIVVFLRKSILMNECEILAFNSAYDHMIMFESIGMLIKGEGTENTRLVTDVIYRHWESIKNHFNDNVGWRY